MRRDPEKAREWQRRSAARAAERRRERAAQGSPQMGRSKPLRRSRPRRKPEGPLTPREWQRTVWQLDGERCTVTGRRAQWPRDFPIFFQVHHPVPKQVLRDMGLYDFVWDPRNGIVLATRVHERHELAVERIPLDILPARCREFASELGPWAEDRLARVHPPREGGAA